MRDQHVAGRRMLMHDDRRGLYARLLGDQHLDLAELDPVAADLHLVVDPAVVDEAAASIDAHGIAGAVQHRVQAITGPERVDDEFPARQLRQVDVAARHARSAYQQLPDLAGCDRLEPVVDHVDRVIGDRSADRHRIAGRQLGVGRNHRRLGRAIGVQQPPAGPGEAIDEGLRTGLATQHDHAQAGTSRSNMESSVGTVSMTVMPSTSRISGSRSVSLIRSAVATLSVAPTR